MRGAPGMLARTPGWHGSSPIPVTPFAVRSPAKENYTRTSRDAYVLVNLGRQSAIGEDRRLEVG